MQLSKNFTLEEMLYSSTAEAKGINNKTTDPVIIENLRALCTYVLQPTRDNFGPLTVSSGYSCLALATVLGRKPNSQHCFDDQTEILTTSGWKNINNITYDNIPFTYNLKTKNIEKDCILNIIKRPFNGELFCASTKHIDYATTDLHRMLVASPPHKNKEPIWYIAPSKGIKDKRLLFLSSSKVLNNKSQYNLDMLKLCIAVICDGCIYQKKDANSPIIRFNISKDRKIKWLEDILCRLNIPYNKRFCKNREKQNQFGVYEITINQTESKKILPYIEKGKTIPYWYLDLSSEELKELIYTYNFFDGSKDFRNTKWKYISIATVNKHNADVLQAMCMLTGLRCTISTINRSTGYGDYLLYTLNIVPKMTSRVNETQYFTKEYSGYVWCIETLNTTLICRRNGKAFICGNCVGEAADIVSSKVSNLEIADWLSRNIDFDQLIYERRYRRGTKQVYDWVHVSYKKDGKNRNQVLHSPVQGGYLCGLPKA